MNAAVLIENGLDANEEEYRFTSSDHNQALCENLLNQRRNAKVSILNSQIHTFD